MTARMRSYAQYCPVAKASEVLGDRWTLLIVREMLGGASGFNELQRGLPGISRSVLTDRLRALERTEIVERRTAQGQDARVWADARRPRPQARRAGDRRVGRDLVVHRAPSRGARSRPADRLDGPPRRPRAASPEPNRGQVRLSRSRRSATGWCSSRPRSRSACSIPASTSTSSHRRHRRVLPRLPGPGGTGRRDTGTRGHDGRPYSAPARVRPLVCRERLRPCQPRRRQAAQGCVTPRQPPQGANRRLTPSPPTSVRHAPSIENPCKCRDFP